VRGVVNHLATVESAVVRRNTLKLRPHVRAGYHAVGEVRAAVRATPLQIDKWYIALPHRHDVRARQFPLATARLTPDDQTMAAEPAPGRENSQATSAYAG
jgi:hypothetical protein